MRRRGCLASESMAVELHTNFFFFAGSYLPPAFSMGTYLGKPLPHSLQPFLLESNIAVYIWCFLSPKQFLNSTDCHKSLPGHVESGKLAQLPAEEDICSAHEPLFIFMVLSSLIEHRSSLGRPLCARWGFRRQGYKEECNTVPFLQDLQCGRDTDIKQKDPVLQTKFHRTECHRTKEWSVWVWRALTWKGRQKQERGFSKERTARVKAYT